MTFNIVPFVKSDYLDILVDIIGAPKAPYEPNTVTTAFMAVLDKAFQTGVLTEEQVEYIIQRVAVETGAIQKMINVGRAASAAGRDSANEELDAALTRVLRRVNALNDGGIAGMLADDAEAAGHGFIVLNVDENTTKEQFDAAWTQAGLAGGEDDQVIVNEKPEGDAILISDQTNSDNNLLVTGVQKDAR